jgi:hypothetical protein
MVTALAMFRPQISGESESWPQWPAFAAQPSLRSPKVKVLAAKTGSIPAD